MNCAFHSNNIAVVNCNGCGRALCPACDHRIKGFPHCQECIVAGIELLRQQQNQAANSTVPARQGSPLLAVLLSLICPGLGAAYNAQNAKALAHFGVFVGLFQLALLTEGTPLFVLGFLGMWLFAAVDAFRTARAIESGYKPEVDDLLTRQLSGNPLVWAVSLIVLGGLFFSYTVLNVRLPINQLLPVLLIALGVYWLIIYNLRKQPDSSKEASFAVHPAAFEDTTFTSASGFEDTAFTSGNVAQFRTNKFSD